MFSSRYVILFTLSMTVIVAVLLSGLYNLLKPTHDANEAIYNKRQILGAVAGPLNIKPDALSDEEVQAAFKKVTQLTINSKGEEIQVKNNAGGEKKAEKIKMEKEVKKAVEDRDLPVFVMDVDGKQYHILSVYGNGLWDKIWGWIAVEPNGTIVGSAFGHKGETPGLGAEIKDNPTFSKGFEGLKIYNDKGELAPIIVRKGGARSKVHEVDAITGATITCDGVTKMIQEGLNIVYKDYLAKIKK